MRVTRRFLVAAVFCSGLSGFAGPAPATPITLHNPGFEIPVLPDGGAASFNVSPTGWIASGSVALILNPTGGTFGAVPEGANVALLDFGQIALDTTLPVNQVLISTGTTYTLTVEIGRDAASTVSFPTGTIELLAGGSPRATQAFFAPGTEPAAGTFTQVTVAYTAPPADAGLLLEIQISSTGGSSGAANLYADDLRLDATVPEPSRLLLLNVGLLALACYRPMRNRRPGEVNRPKTGAVPAATTGLPAG